MNFAVFRCFLLIGVLASSAAPRAALAKPSPTKGGDADPTRNARAKASHRHKPTAARAGHHGGASAHKASAVHCERAPITLDRTGLESQPLVLLDCHEQPVASAREALSILARPWGTPKPAHPAAQGLGPRGKKPPVALRGGRPDDRDIAPSIRLLDAGLLTRIAVISRRFPGRAISIVSGYRPQSRGSLHQQARALDLRVAGVANEDLVAFCKTLRDTGCGYYPNSSFVHVDVRAKGSGSASWIDASGPGEAPHYVAQWPLPARSADVAVLPPDLPQQDSARDRDSLDEHSPWLPEDPPPLGRPRDRRGSASGID